MLSLDYVVNTPIRSILLSLDYVANFDALTQTRSRHRYVKNNNNLRKWKN
jgi:hypothetical protein